MKLLGAIITAVFYLFFINAQAFPADSFTLTTTSFSNKEKISALYTCDGKDTSPALAWQHAPINTKTFALVVYDPDAPGGIFYHWVLYNIPKNMSALPEGVMQLPANTIVGRNSFGREQYNGPCPPPGMPHHYVFNLYALNVVLDFTASQNGATILAAAKQHMLAKAELVTQYGR